MLVVSDRRSAAMVGRDKEAVDFIFHSFKDACFNCTLYSSYCAWKYELFMCIIAHKSFLRQINLT